MIATRPTYAAARLSCQEGVKPETELVLVCLHREAIFASGSARSLRGWEGTQCAPEDNLLTTTDGVISREMRIQIRKSF